MATTPDSDLRTRLRGEPDMTPEDTRAELLQEVKTAELRNRVRSDGQLSPEDTRSELLAHEARKAENARREREKEERKAAEAEAMRREREARAKAMTDEQAKSKAASDVAALAAVVALGARGASDAYYQRSDMAELANWNEGYNKALAEAAPDVHKAVLENEQNGPRIDLTAFNAKQAEVTLEKYEAAAAHVDAFMATKPGDEQARAAIAAQMQERGESDTGYVNALKRITPDLSTLAEEHTPGLREEHYRFAQAERAEHVRNDPEFLEREVPLSEASEVRLSDAQLKAANAQAVQDAASRSELPGKLDLNNPEDRAFKADLEASQQAATQKGLQDQLDAELERRKAREREQAQQGLNSVDVQKTGRELERGDFIMPRRIEQAYTEVDGKFYAKESNRVMFEDKGEKLATSTTDKKAIEDMVALAKAKNWESLKLTGSQEFRREAWLQAESQGIRTQGYTPKEKDLAELEKMRQERSTNSIQPLQERQKERAQEREATAPRHDLNKNQAQMGVAMKTTAHEHLEAVKKIPGLEGKSFEHLNEIARMRALVAERDKLRPPAEQAETLARFDKMATDPQFQKRVQQETIAKVEDKTVERVQKRDTHEQSL